MDMHYPVRLEIDYPERLGRLSTAFRVILIIPIAIVLGLLSGGGSYGSYGDETQSVGLAASGTVVIPTVLLLLFRQKYPGWWFDWNVELTRFSTRVSTYFLLLTDRYPSTDEEQAVHLEIDRPDSERDLNRWLPLVKWILALPHYIVLFFLAIAAFFVLIIAWFAILFTGRYPHGLFDFTVGVNRWGLRVLGYAFLLVTDRYPPFSLKGEEGAPPAEAPATA
jgi:hypothetical protein